MERGNVTVRAQVDAYGKHSSVVKEIFGVSSKPAAGSLLAPEKNCRIFPRDTHLPSVINDNKILSRETIAEHREANNRDLWASESQLAFII